MKLKKIRVRLKDIHHGKVLYIAHPAFGIDRVQIVGKPRTVMLGAILGLKGHPTLFIDTIPLDWEWWDHTKTDSRSLCDMGVYNAYGHRRTFHSLKQAEQYVARTANCPIFQRSHRRHLAQCNEMDHLFYNDWDGTDMSAYDESKYDDIN